MRALIGCAAVVLCGCNGEADPTGLAVLGFDTQDLADSVQLDVVLDGGDDLNLPRDLAFDPETPGRLWVVNRDDNSVTIVDDAGGPSQASQHIIDPYAVHFMAEVSSIDFGQSGTFGTCQESRNTFNGTQPANDFMGPTLWSSDLEVFGKTNPEAVDFLTQLFGFPVDLGSHLDMQHETPLCTGIAWETDNVYWAFDGRNETIDRVDFREDHGPGYDDHSDGVTSEYLPGEIGYEEGVPNHMEFDQATGYLYIADPVNARVMRFDTTTGSRGNALAVTEPGTQRWEMTGGDLTVLVSDSRGLDQPSGLALIGTTLFVTDYGTGFIHAFDTATGEEIDRLDTGRGAGAIMGIVAPTIDELWLTDASTDEVLRITPLPQE